MNQGVKLSEVQQPTAAATVSKERNVLLVVHEHHFTSPPPHLPGGGAGLAFLSAWIDLWLHVLWLCGGHASQTDSGSQPGCLSCPQVHQQVPASTLK